MKALKGKVAVVTGAASGIGLGMARAFAGAGMHVAMCDIRAGALEPAVKSVASRGGVRTLGIELDVSDRAAVEAAAQRIEAHFGKIHLVANNAGVAMHGVPIEKLSPKEWDWVIGVNLYGVIHGIQAFLPRIRRHGEGGHIVNTASIGGFQVNPNFRTAPYSMTKYAVVALSEGLEKELEGSGIGVSVLAPASVNSHIHLTADSRPARFGGPYRRRENEFMGDLIKDGMAPDEVGRRVLAAVRNGDFYIFTHPETREWIEKRYRRIIDAFERAERVERPAKRKSSAAD